MPEPIILHTNAPKALIVLLEQDREDEVEQFMPGLVVSAIIAYACYYRPHLNGDGDVVWELVQ